MRRLALLLATSASVLGTGCVASSSSSDAPCRVVSIGWPSFQLADGTITSSCSVAGVSSVDLYMNDLPVGRFPCGNGGVSVTDVPVGTNLFTVEGVVTQGSATTVLLRHEVSVTTSDVCAEQIVDTRPAEGVVTLDYAFTRSGGLCTASGSYLWFSIYDQIARAVTAVADETANTTSYICGQTISFAMPVGGYTLDRMEEVVPLIGGGYSAKASNCNGADFAVDPGVESIVQVDLANTSQFCPASTAAAVTLEKPRTPASSAL